MQAEGGIIRRYLLCKSGSTLRGRRHYVTAFCANACVGLTNHTGFSGAKPALKISLFSREETVNSPHFGPNHAISAIYPSTNSQNSRTGK